MTTELSAAERQRLVAAHADLTRGRAAEALAVAEPLAARHRGDADAQMVAGLANELVGNNEIAEKYFAAALDARPGDRNIRNIHANSVAANGDHSRALELFAKLLDDDPYFTDAHINRAITAAASGDYELALRLATESLTLFPDEPRLLAARGAIAKNAGALDRAADDLERAAALSPQSARTHHDLAVVLNVVGEPHRACAHFARAAELGMRDVDTASNWAAALVEAGEIDAGAQLYRQVIAHDPAHPEAARALTRLVHEYATGDDAFAHYRGWTEQWPADQRAWCEWIRALVRFEQWQDVRSTAEHALEIHPNLLPARVEAAFARGMLGDAAGAAAQLEEIALQAPEAAPGLVARRMQLWLMARDPERAADLGEQHVAGHPFDQSVLAYLATAWRMLDDEREFWLCDYERLVRQVEVRSESGKGAVDYAADICEVLDRLHATTRAPGDQSLRHGTQTSGALFARRDPAVRAFRDAIVAAAAGSIAGLHDDPTHPFLARKSRSLTFSGSWSVRLSATGFHVAHFHAQGWMSSAFYARLPEQSEAQRARHEGWIEFGRPPDALRLDLSARRLVEPEPGMMVLFPSYMWHATVPFSSGDRLTAAFDFVPGRS